MDKTVLVLGGTGKTGKRVVNRLLRLNQPVRIGSRNATPAFEWNNDKTWEAILTDVAKVYITFQPDLAVPGAVEIVQAFVNKAVEMNIEKLVLLSGRGEKEAQLCEQIVISSGIPWTIVRASWFSQNFSESYLLDSVKAGYVALPTGGVREPFIDVEDIADVVTAALTNEKHSGKIYELTGPRLMTFETAVNEISKAAEFAITYEEISISDYMDMLKKYNTPIEFMALLKYLFTEVLDGRNEFVCDGVEQALGRRATDFSDYVTRTVKSKIWTQ